MLCYDSYMTKMWLKHTRCVHFYNFYKNTLNSSKCNFRKKNVKWSNCVKQMTSPTESLVRSLTVHFYQVSISATWTGIIRTQKVACISLCSSVTTSSQHGGKSDYVWRSSLRAGSWYLAAGYQKWRHSYSLGSWKWISNDVSRTRKMVTVVELGTAGGSGWKRWVKWEVPCPTNRAES